jgi:riboflavin transporter FmnP
MNTKKLSLTIVFAALAIALNPAFTPSGFFAPYAPGLFYEVWEIPIVVAFLLISPVVGLAISLVNTAVLFAVFPGALPTGPLYNLAATLSMQAGIFSAYIIAKRVRERKSDKVSSELGPKWAATSTGMGILTRVAAMSVVLYFALPLSSPIGYSYPLSATIAYLPFAAFFNATLALYTIPIGYLIANRVQKILKLNLPK